MTNAPTPAEVQALLYRAYLAGRADGYAEATSRPRPPPPATAADYATWRARAMAGQRATLAYLRGPDSPHADRCPCARCNGLPVGNHPGGPVDWDTGKPLNPPRETP